LHEGRETHVLQYSVHGAANRLFKGREIFLKLLKGNSILAAAGMVRREAYDRVGRFPLDLPFSGDWYLWLMFSLHFDAFYIAEPMVNYRYHELAMSNALAQQDVHICSRNDLALLWRICEYVEELDDKELLMHSVDAIASHYGDQLASKPYRGGSRGSMTLDQFEASLSQHPDRSHDLRIRSRAFAVAADRFYWIGQLAHAREFCLRALQEDPWMARVWAKYLLLRAGAAGNYARQLNIRLKHALSRARRNRPGASISS
jgi:hypothetical protein